LLFRSLAEPGQRCAASAEDLPRHLVSARRAGPIYLAGIWREHARAAMDRRADPGTHARCGRNIAWPDAALRGPQLDRPGKALGSAVRRTRPDRRCGVERRTRLPRRAFRQAWQAPACRTRGATWSYAPEARCVIVRRLDAASQHSTCST